MHVALLIDETRLRYERDWFSRTVVGLVSAGVRVTRLLPEDEPDDHRVSLASALWYESKGVPWSAKGRYAKLAGQLSSAKETPDIIHAMGRGAWSAALSLGRNLERPIVIDVWSREEARAAVGHARNEETAAVLVADPYLARLLEQDVDPSLIQVVPIGIHVPDQPREVLTDPESGIACVVAGRQASFSTVRPLVEAIGSLVDRYPSLMVFGDFDQRVGDRVWNLMRSLGILDRCSLIPDVVEHRELVMQSDVLVIPHTTGANGTFLLQAMAVPMAVVSEVDECVEVLQDEESVFLIEPNSTKDNWVNVLDGVLSDRDRRQTVSDRGRDRMLNEHPMSRQVQVLAETYDQVVSGETYRLGKGDRES